MPKYKAFLTETLTHTIEFEADNFDTACSLAYELVENGEPNSYTTDSEGLSDLDIKEIN